METWRLLVDDAVGASHGLAVDEVLALGAGSRTSPTSLRLYTYNNWSALVGRFQNIHNELHLPYCTKHGIHVNRRPTGGGAIIMGENQLGIALCIPGRGDTSYGNAKELMRMFSQGITHALSQLGIDGVFTRKNDIEVKGKKVAGLGVNRTPSGGMLFHGSLLVDLDVSFMLRVLNTPFEKISDKEITTVSRRITTVRRETASGITVSEVRTLVAKGYESVFGIALEGGQLTDREMSDANQLSLEKYDSPEWINQNSSVGDLTGNARRKTESGLITVRVALAGSQLKAVYLEGDFFSSEDAIAAVEGSLRWHSIRPEKVEGTLIQVFRRFQSDLAPIPIDLLHGLIIEAIEKASPQDSSDIEPYGCFVSPGSRTREPAIG